MIMDAYEVYRYYLALRLHFTTDAYDVVKQRGKVKASKQAFLKRKDLFAIRKIADTYSDKEVVNFLVSNFVSGDRWGGVFDTEAKDRYLDWKKRIESLTYLFDKEISVINNFCSNKGIEFEHIFVSEKNQHPYIIKLFLRKDISIETLVILECMFNYSKQLDEVLATDLVWPDISRLIKKYKPFLEVNLNKYTKILAKYNLLRNEN